MFAPLFINRMEEISKEMDNAQDEITFLREKLSCLKRKIQYLQGAQDESNRWLIEFQKKMPSNDSLHCEVHNLQPVS